MSPPTNPVRFNPVKLSALIRTYLTHVQKEHRTANKAERVLTSFLALVGDRRAADVSGFQVEKWKLARARDVGQSTVNRELNVVKGLFHRAVEWKLLRESPATAIRKYRTDDTRIRVLTEAEIQTVLTQAPSDMALLCRATLECLPRISELLSLRREHIGASWIEIRRKGGRVERIAVSPELRTALLARAHRNGFIFGEGRTGEPATQEATSVRFTRLMRRLELSGVSHHTMRHTGVTLMLEKGISPRAIQKLAGWTTLRMLERYGHARDAETQRAVTTMHAYLETAIERPRETAGTTNPETPKQISKQRAQTRAQRGSQP
jgi:integrase